MEDVSVNQLMSENELIDVLFHTCDVTKTGRVRAASVVAYVEKMTDMHSQHEEAVEYLYRCLDPRGENAEIDIGTYRAGMSRWIEQIRSGVNSREMAESKEDDADEEPETQDVHAPVYSPYFRGYSAVLMEELPFEEPRHLDRGDTIDCTSRLEDLEHANHRLSQDNYKLQAQLDSQEDFVATLTQDKQNLENKIRRLQEIADVQSEILAENEELKASVERLQEQKREQESRIHQLEKENAHLAAQLAASEEKLQTLTSEAEASKAHVQGLQQIISEQKASLRNGRETQKRQELELLEKDLAVAELEMSVTELSRLSKELSSSNEELQHQISGLQEQVARQSHQQFESSVPLLMSAGNSDSDDENSWDENAGTSRPLPVSTPPVADADQSASIHREIEETLEYPMMDAGPLCSKEQTEMLGQNIADIFSLDEPDFGVLVMKLCSILQPSIFPLAGVSGGTNGADNARSSPAFRHTGRDTEENGNSIQENWHQGLRQLVFMVMKLREENQRLHQLHDSAVKDMLGQTEAESSEVTAEDCRIVVLRNLLLEERTQKLALEQQLETLKRMVAIVDHRDGVDFEAIKEALFLQQEKVQQLERSNLELAEKYHKAELKVTDLQEEALQAALTLDREKHRCSKLEDAVSTTALARQLDLKEIWRLVQKDVENEYLENQDDSGISASTDELKEKIVQEIKTLRNQLYQHQDSQGTLDRPKMSLPLQRTGQSRVSSHCCGYRCSSPSSPLVDALTIDVFNGNYYMMPKKSSALMDPYVNYLRLSCEDVDCMECRAVRLGMDLHGAASCPSLQLRLGHEVSGYEWGSMHGMLTPLDYNFNSRSRYPGTAGPQTGSVATTSAGEHTEIQGPVLNNSGNSNSTYISTPTTARHRRLDFGRGSSSSQWTSGTLDSFTSASLDSTSDSFTTQGSYLPKPTSQLLVETSNVSSAQSAPCSFPYQSSPAGYRRMSFLAAVDKSKQREGDWNRRPSYRAAVDPSYLGTTPSQPPVQTYQNEEVHGRLEIKTVTFQLGDDDDGDDDHGISTSFSSSSDSDTAFGWGSGIAQSARVDGSRARKLSTLLEEDGEDRSPEHRRTLSPGGKTSPSEEKDDHSSADREGNRSTSQSLERETQKSPGPRQPASDDPKAMKTAYLMSAEDSPGSMASHPACNADNMPAHFKHSSNVRLTVTTASSPAPVPTPTTNSTAGQPVVLVPGSPPQTPRSAHEDKTASAVPPSRLAKLRLSNLARKREQMKTMKMPELSESAEADADTGTTTNGSISTSSRKGSSLGSRRLATISPPEISVTSDEEDNASKSGDGVVRPPSPSDDLVTPSIPESFLKQLGLSTEGREMNGEGGVDQLPDKELESRFNSLALAFKTDRLTLEKRLGIQERSRDIAEQNIEKELQGLRDAVEMLNRLCSDEQVQDVVAKIHHHLDILEHSVARVSSRAEVFGAVQQEKRMCLAMEVMITFTENIRRLRDKEHAEVEEARKVLSERSQSSSSLGLDFGDRRSASVCVGLNNPRTLTQRSRTLSPTLSTISMSSDRGDMMMADTRRRSEIALPRYFGGSGSPSLHVSSSMDAGNLSDLQQSFGASSRQALGDQEAPRQRFQAATANVTVRNSITSSLRRASLERQNNLSLQSSSSSSGQSRNNSVEQPGNDRTDTVRQSSQEEEAYKLGYEEGLKASLGQKLNELRDQQTTISNNVEQVMDRIETLQQEDTNDAELDETVTKVKDIIVQVRHWMSNPNWQSASHTLRRLAAGIIFLVAVIVVILTFAPLVPGNITMRNHGKPAQ